MHKEVVQIIEQGEKLKMKERKKMQDKRASLGE